MKRVIWIGAPLLLAAACWGGGALCHEEAAKGETKQRTNRTISAVGASAGAVRLAGAQGSVEVRPSEFEAATSQTWTLPRDGAGELRVRITNGSLRVLAGEGDQIQIQGNQKARAGSEAEARALLAPLPLDRHREGDRWIVEGNWPLKVSRRHRGDRDYSDAREVTLEIHLPREMRLEAENRFGGIEIAGIPDARLRASLGGITARDVTGRLEAHTDTGGIRVERCTGAIQAEASTGGITIRQTTGPVRATTGTGGINMEVAPGDSAAPVELVVGTGAIDLRVPESASVRLVADTSSLSRVEMEPFSRAQFNPGHNHLEAVLGAGKGSIRLRSGLGAIHIRMVEGR
jgi:hypothetical protein